MLPDNKVLDFLTHPNQNKSKKNKKLVESIKVAYQILHGLTTIEGNFIIFDDFKIFHLHVLSFSN